jgi:biopolymer transport protein ExbB
MTTSLLLQITQPSVAVPAAATATTSAEKAVSMFDIFLKGGWILVPICLMSVIAVYVIIARWVELHQASKAHNLVDTISVMLKEGKVDMAISTCEISNLPVGKMLAAGLRTLGSPIKDIQDAMESEARQQIDILNKGMHYLAIISSVAPMFGFLGTIFGVIKIFYNISLADNISIGIISGGLYQKMISSAAGLTVGIIAFAGYHLLNARIDKITSSMEREGNRLVSLLRNNSL